MSGLNTRFRRGRPREVYGGTRFARGRFGDGRFGEGRFQNRFDGRRFDDSQIRPQVLPYQTLPQDDQERRNALEFIFDVLSTGQYLTANVAEDVMAGQWRAPIRGALTHGRRGDWEDVIFGGPSSVAGAPAQRGLIPVADEPGGGRRVLRGVGGFLGNLLFDPTTYVTFGGTTAARAGAQSFARMAVNQARRQLADPEVTQRIFGARAARRGLSAAQRRRVIGDAPMNQYLSRVWSDAYKEALTTPSATLRTRYARRLAAERRNAADTRRALDGNDAAWAKEAREEAEGRVAAVGEELRKVLDDDAWNVGIRGDPDFRGFRALGEGAWKVLGMELPTGQAGRVRRAVAEVGAAVRRAGREFPVTKRFLDAWWSQQTNGVIGAIRHRLGFFRSGYQTMVRNVELGLESQTQDVLRRNVDSVRGAFADKSAEVQAAYTKLMSAVYDRVGETVVQAPDAAAQRTALIEATREALDDPAVRAVVPAELWDETIDLWSRVRTITDRWAAEEAQMAVDGFLEGADYVVNYLPIQWRPEPGELPRARKRGSMRFSPLFERKSSFSYQRLQEIRQQAAFFGMPGDVAAEIVDSNAGRLVADAEQLLIGRGIANARMVGRKNLLSQMRPMGLNVKEVGAMSGAPAALPELGGGTFRTHPDEALRKALVDAYESGDLSHIGLYGVPGEKFLEGWVYDKEVRDILERTVDATGADIQVVGRALRNYTTWLKGILTLRPGFHARNAISNQAMMYLREGPRAFSLRFLRPGLVGAVHQLVGPESRLTRAADAALTKLQQKRVLQWKFGEHTVEELSDWAVKHGVISRISQAGDPRDLYGEAKRRSAANPLRWQDALFDASKNTGALIESMQRFSLFLMEVDRLVKPGLRLTEGELEWATFAARRWMVDYNNLTEFEQKFMKHLIPFYAWMRFNVKNVVEGIIDAPGLYASAFKGQESLSEFISGDLEPDYEELPDWVRDAGSVPVGRGEDGQIVMANLGMPWNDLNMFALTMPAQGELDLPRLDAVELVRELASRAHPAVQSAFEVATGKTLFRDRSLERQAPVPRALRGLEAAPRVLAFLDGVARVGWSPTKGLGFVDPAGRPYEDSRGRLMMDAKAAHALSNFLPVLKWLGQALDGPIWLAEQAGVAVEEALDNARLGRDDYDNLDEFLRLLSWYAGVAATQVDPRQVAFRRQQERRREQREQRNPYATVDAVDG